MSGYEWETVLDRDLGLHGDGEGSFRYRGAALTGETDQGRYRGAALGQFEGEIIGGVDNRQLVANTTFIPSRWVCKLWMTFQHGGDGWGGSGLLISPRHVLTCGHNLRDWDKDRDLVDVATAITVIPGYNSLAATKKPAGEFHADMGRSRTSYIWGQKTAKQGFNKALAADYALITLTNAVNADWGYWSHPTKGAGTEITVVTPSELVGREVRVSGYPMDKTEGDGEGTTQWTALGQVATSVHHPGQLGTILHTASTKGGHSGSPMWIKDGNKMKLVAIHTGSWEYSGGMWRSNRATAITSEMWKEVKSWLG